MASIQFTCKNCGDTFQGEKELSKHRRLDCKKKPYSCPECGQLLSRRDSLRQHLQRHDSGKKYPCPFCQKMFDQQQNLKVHLRIHSGERPYKCPECGREFNQSQNLTTHLRVHSGVKPYVCKDCGATFRFCSGYKSHISRSHNPSKQAGKRGGKSRSSQKQRLQRPEEETLVHRVSVIAKVSSTSSMDDFASTENCSLKVNSEDNCSQSFVNPAEIPSSFNAGLLTNSTKHVSPPILPVLRFTCQQCNIVVSQGEVMQHMMIVHGLSYDVIKISKDINDTNKDPVL